jgi:hypothetical protein
MGMARAAAPKATMVVVVRMSRPSAVRAGPGSRYIERTAEGTERATTHAVATY